MEPVGVLEMLAQVLRRNQQLLEKFETQAPTRVTPDAPATVLVFSGLEGDISAKGWIVEFNQTASSAGWSDGENLTVANPKPVSCARLAAIHERKLCFVAVLASRLPRCLYVRPPSKTRFTPRWRSVILLARVR